MATNEELMYLDLRLDEQINRLNTWFKDIFDVNTILLAIDIYYIIRRLNLKQKCILLILQDRGVL